MSQPQQQQQPPPPPTTPHQLLPFAITPSASSPNLPSTIASSSTFHLVHPPSRAGGTGTTGSSSNPAVATTMKTGIDDQTMSIPIPMSTMPVGGGVGTGGLPVEVERHLDALLKEQLTALETIGARYFDEMDAALGVSPNALSGSILGGATRRGDLLQSLQSQLDQLTRSLLTSGLGSLPISTPSPSDAMSMDPTPSAAAATGGDLVSSLPDTMDAFCESLQEGLRENFGKRQSVREVGAIVEGVLKS